MIFELSLDLKVACVILLSILDYEMGSRRIQMHTMSVLNRDLPLKRPHRCSRIFD